MSELFNKWTPSFCHAMTEILLHRPRNLYHHASTCPDVRLCTFTLAVLLLLPALFSNSAYAGNLSLLVNGKAWHMNPPKDVKYNEENWGAGIQYDFKSYGEKWIPFISASGFLDSFENPSYYTGLGLVRRYHFGQRIDSRHFDAGVIGFFMTREDYRRGNPFFGMLPALSYGNRRFAVNITYIPKVQPKMVALWFFQFKISTAVF